ncbi:MAG: septal ring lytic transglycosylase RlpA family protein [Campylobacter sp.]|nr:septal ring lytic transglycosylase RlpA family protein [Campylobacter sp.]
MRPYKVNGKTYYPQKVSVGDSQKGIASWYGPGFHGKKTSNGETYNMRAMTAAHKTYPMNTMVKVVNLKNGRSEVVRINDRGPFVSGRIIDLSKAAADKLGVSATGTAPVRIEVVSFDKNAISKTSSSGSTSSVFVGGNFMVQIGAFRNINGAITYKEQFSNFKGYSTVVRSYTLDGEPIHRVFLTGFRSEAEARDFIDMQHFSGAFIVRD